MRVDKLITNCRELVTMEERISGSPMRGAGSITNGAIAIKDGMIVALGNTEDILRDHTADEVLDASGLIALPGFVDSHTHPVFVHTREAEFAMRLAGKSYVEIAQSGGGIRSTLATTREADEETLYALAKVRIGRMICQGTTTLEAKSGYGLTTESELTQLRVIRRLDADLPLDIIPTFMGAHEYPTEYKNDHEAYLRILCEEMIPAVAEQGIAEFCDIFTEAHVYSIAESRRVLRAAKDHGLKLKMHADEIEPIGGAELAAEMGCISADHLGAASDAGILAMAQAGVIPTLLPATLFSLRAKSYARARTMIEAGLPVAIASDYNPGSCNCDSMPMTMTLACLQMGMSPIEALSAATYNAALALGRQDSIGSLKPGKLADVTLWEIPSVDFIPYHFGSSHLRYVLKRGRVIHRDATHYGG